MQSKQKRDCQRRTKNSHLTTPRSPAHNHKDTKASPTPISKRRITPMEQNLMTGLALLLEIVYGVTMTAPIRELVDE